MFLGVESKVQAWCGIWQESNWFGHIKIIRADLLKMRNIRDLKASLVCGRGFVKF